MTTSFASGVGIALWVAAFVGACTALWAVSEALLDLHRCRECRRLVWHPGICLACLLNRRKQ